MESEKVKIEKYRGLVRNILIFGVGLLGSKFVQFILLPYFTNVLTTAEYGSTDLVMTFVGLMVPLVTLELSDSVLRFGLSEETNKGSLIVNAGIILIFSSVIVIFFSPLIVFYKSISEYRWYVVILIITQAFRTNEALFVKANNKVTIYSIDSIMTAIVIAICDIIFISRFEMAARGYFLAEIIGNCCSVLFLFVTGKIGQIIRWNCSVDWLLMKQMLTYSVPLMFNALSWWITSFSDRMILDMFFSTNEVGIYSVAAKIPAIVTTLLSVFTQAWIMSAIKEYEAEKDVRFFENIYIVYSTFLFTFVSILILVIKPVMKFYVGKNFFEAWYYVPFLLLGTVFLGISNYYGAIYASAKANFLEIKSTMICAAANIILNFLFIPKFNILGAVLATAFSYITVVIVRIIDIRKLIKMKNAAKELIVMGCVFSLEIYCVMNSRWIPAVLAGGIQIVFNVMQLKKRGNSGSLKKLMKDRF